MLEQQQTDTRQWARKRRSQRLELNVPVIVYRPPQEPRQFYESTLTLAVSAHGALMILAAEVALNQRLLMQNVDSGEQQECRVANVGRMPTGPTQVGVEFTRPAPNFWRIAYPPVDWAASV
jgi:hypothetical protein